MMGMEVFYMDLGKIFFIDSELHFVCSSFTFFLDEKSNKKIKTAEKSWKFEWLNYDVLEMGTFYNKDIAVKAWLQLRKI